MAKASEGNAVAAVSTSEIFLAQSVVPSHLRKYRMNHNDELPGDQNVLDPCMTSVARQLSCVVIILAIQVDNHKVTMISR